ncbi:MAG: phenylacetate--CoA ligase family protein [Gemmataceae bacterium]
MTPFPLITVPGGSWPPLPFTEAASLWNLYVQLDRTQWLTPAEVRDGQLSQLRELLAHCAAHVPHYRDLFREHAIDPATLTWERFARVPVLARSTYQQQFARFQAEALPAGLAPSDAARTSGTSGAGIEIWRTNLVALWWAACYLRDIAWCGFDARCTLGVIRYFGPLAPAKLAAALAGVTLPNWHAALARLMKTGPAYAIDLRADMRDQVAWLLRVRPDYLLGSPPNLDYLAGLLAEAGRRPDGLRGVQVYSETLEDGAKARMEAAFGAPVKNVYSCTEAGYLASECPDGHGMHVHAENVVLEVLRDDGGPCAPGESGRVVLTSLRNHRTPFVRYEILDAATVGPERCPCGRGLPLLQRVEGRRRSLLRLADGRRKDGRPLLPALPGQAFWQRQIVQQAVDRVLVRVVPRAGVWGPEHEVQIVQALRDYLEGPVDVRVELADRLEGTSGKIRDIVSEIE